MPITVLSWIECCLKWIDKTHVFGFCSAYSRVPLQRNFAKIWIIDTLKLARNDELCGAVYKYKCWFSTFIVTLFKRISSYYKKNWIDYFTL